jgi:hypothetical protein
VVGQVAEPVLEVVGVRLDGGGRPLDRRQVRQPPFDLRDGAWSSPSMVHDSSPESGISARCTRMDTTATGDGQGTPIHQAPGEPSAPRPGHPWTPLLWPQITELTTLALGGWIIDRLPRRTIVLGTDAARALLLLALGVHAPPSSTRASPGGARRRLRRAHRAVPPRLVAYLPELVQHYRVAAANSLLAVSNARPPWWQARRSAPPWSASAPLPPRYAWTR